MPRDVPCGCQRYCCDLPQAVDHPYAICRGLPILKSLLVPAVVVLPKVTAKNEEQRHA